MTLDTDAAAVADAPRGEGLHREPMSRVDTAWLRMEGPTNRMMITGVLMFADAIDCERLRALVADRFLAFRRFRQRAVDTPTGAFWEDDPEFDLAHHLHEVDLPGRAGKRELERLVSRLASSALDHGRPLWQFHIVRRYRGGSALVARVHHCYADGIALIQVLLSLTDTTPDALPASALPAAWLKDDGQRVTRRFFGRSVDRAMKLGGKALEKSLELYRDPTLAAVLAKEGGEIARELVHALSLSDDPPTALRGELGADKRVAWAEPLSLEEVKTVGRALGCTVNDVLLACAAGALRAHLRECGDDVDGLTVRATVPVNLRPLEHAKKLGNHFGLVFLDLPLGEPNPLARLMKVAQAMRELKGSRQAVVAYGLLATLGITPPAVQRVALELLSRKASAVATNVPGPQLPLYLAGARIDELMFWVPQTGSIGVGISILSYDGAVHFGLIADARRIADPDAVIRRFGHEFEKLLLITLMEDWDGPITPSDAAETLRRYSSSGGRPSSQRRASSASARRRSSSSR